MTDMYINHSAVRTTLKLSRLLFHASIFITSLSVCDSEWLWILQCEPKTLFLFTAVVKFKYDETFVSPFYVYRFYFLYMCSDLWTSVYCLNRYYDNIVILWFITTWAIQSLKHFCFGWLEENLIAIENPVIYSPSCL